MPLIMRGKALRVCFNLRDFHPIFGWRVLQRQWSQEVRYAASGDKIDYVVGVYGFYQTIDTNGVQEQGPLASRWLLSGANANRHYGEGAHEQRSLNRPMAVMDDTCVTTASPSQASKPSECRRRSADSPT